jgi:hypothetical protein
MGPDGNQLLLLRRKKYSYNPKYYLPISYKGYEEGVFVMSLGLSRY